MESFGFSFGFNGGKVPGPLDSGSLAAIALRLETNGLALDFTDTSLFATTGFYGSARIKDVSTPANVYDSAPVKTASSLLTYTSPSPKLTLGPAGTYRYQPHNLYLNSAAPANQSITVTSGATYSVTITGTVSVTASGAATGTWTVGTNTFTASTGTLTLGSTSGAGTVHVRRTPSDSTYLATTSAARYGLPYEWNTSGVLQGILVEEARTNISTYSSQPANAAWTKGLALTATDNAVDGPFGTNTASALREVAGNFAEKTIATPAANWTAAAYTFSIYAKAVGRDYISIQGKDSGGVNRKAWFNLATGTVGTVETNITAATITPVGNGWHRCAVTITLPSYGAVRWVLDVTHADNAASFGVNAGDATKGINIWGAQLELGSFPTSPIETFASSVTRARDVLTLATSAFPLSATAGTMFALFDRGYGDNTYIIDLDNGSLAEAHIVHASNTGQNITAYTSDNSAGQANPDFAAVTSPGATNLKAAYAFAANDFALSFNGATPLTDASGTMPTPTQLALFGLNTNGNPRLRKIMYLPRRMTNAELQTVTT